jgi:hypothetical protein|uniref:Uncharacterized protein n=1 Tax=Eutreptiella gymnastica TaxID=73025 RepID=A0A7S4LD71_9EUGL|mmetsp:Transcript_65154/g.108212  ORF Transcript_65154/g.108212 Transcript_65154/m.108212 type:complete len:123 (+) Transcript_65154:109-477(+)
MPPKQHSMEVKQGAERGMVHGKGGMHPSLTVTPKEKGLRTRKSGRQRSSRPLAQRKRNRESGTNVPQPSLTPPETDAAAPGFFLCVAVILPEFTSECSVMAVTLRHETLGKSAMMKNNKYST